ncbi:MAG: transposase [Rhodobacteraceae bacterium]|nr:transposase [Paracoccaceae bacterium]
MNRHLVDIGSAVPLGRHALAVLDGAGWHRSKSLEIPDDVPLLRLPPYSPELNPVETVFQFLKRGNFANQVFATAEEVKDRVEKVWNDSARTPGRIASLGRRGWTRLVTRLVTSPTAQPAQHASPGE